MRVGFAETETEAAHKAS